MSLIEEALTELITGDPGVSALISDRFQPHPLTQGSTYPAISYMLAFDVKVHSHRNDPDTNGITGLSMPLFQFDLWAVDYAGVKDLAEKLRLAIDTFRGTVLGVAINGILFQNGRDIFEERVSDDKQRLHRILTEYQVMYNEPQS